MSLTLDADLYAKAKGSGINLSKVADTGRDRVVAPLAPRAAMPTLAGRLIPIVKVATEDYALLVPPLTALPAIDLRHVVANLADDRERILAALDHLSIGF